MQKELLSNLVISKVYSASTLFSSKMASGQRNNRQFWAVAVKYEGETIYTSNGRDVLSDCNHIVLLPKGCTYTWQCTKAGHFCIVDFESDFTGDEPISFYVKNCDKILRQIKDLEYKRNLKNATTELESIRDVYSILVSLMKADSNRYYASEKQKKIAAAIEYISQNFNSSITNDELAELTGLSTVYFRKLFTQIVGTSPIAYAHNLRIEKAKEILKTDFGSLSDLAQTLGYANLYDFSRDFKKHTGLPPSQYKSNSNI